MAAGTHPGESDILPEASRRMPRPPSTRSPSAASRTTTRDIAARANLSPAALYVHYPSKAALLAQISLHGHRSALALLEAAISSATDPVARFAPPSPTSSGGTPSTTRTAPASSSTSSGPCRTTPAPR